MGYSLSPTVSGIPPVIVKDPQSTTSWRDAKKALRQWYLDEAHALRNVTEKTYFVNPPTDFSTTDAFTQQSLTF
jgi:hypothetical protein